MIPHDILTLYSAKMVEYVLGVVFLIAFIPFWRFVFPSSPATAREAVTVPGLRASLAEWFSLPTDRLFHKGHAWAQTTASGLVTVGLTDFAAKMLGPSMRMALPQPGSRVSQGDRAWQFTADGRTVDMLSPVDGTVVEVNPDIARRPEALLDDPYGTGWLFRVQPSRLRANLTNLLSGKVARQWMEQVSENLRLRLAPSLGALAQDGGAPVAGMARSIDPEHWDQLARTFFLTDGEDSHA
jgi:glycine cleavage system H protein